MKSKLSNWNLWLDYLAERKGIYFVGIFSAVITCFFQTLSPRIVGWTIDALKGEAIPPYFQEKNQTETVMGLLFFLILSEFFLIIFRIGWRLILARNTHFSNAYLRKKIWNHVKYLSNEKLNHEYNVGNLMNISTSDVGTGRYLFGFTIVAFIDVIFLSLFCLISMFLINKEMTFYTIILFPILPYFFRKLAIEESNRHENAQKLLSKFNDFCSEAIASIRLNKMIESGLFWERRLTQTADDYRKERLKVIYTSYKFFPLMGITTLFSYLILFFLGVVKTASGELTIGNFVAFQGAIFLVQGPLIEIGPVISEWQRGMSGLKRIVNILNDPRDPHLFSEGTNIRENGPVIRVSNLKIFSPPVDKTNRKEIISNLNLELSPGDRLGIMGPIGSGKTTFIQILAGLYHEYQGDYLLHGRSIKQYGHKELTGFIKIASQRPFLFADTIRNNITLDRDMSDREIWRLLELVDIDKEILKMADGLDTSLGEWGVNLSGGQKQRLSLARSIAGRPKILLLDDCLSAVDIGTEETILSNLNDEFKKTTIVWTAHRESTLRHCHSILNFGLMENKNERA